MKKFFCLCIAVVTALAALAADKADDQKSLQGTWLPVKAELGGHPMPAAVLKTISLKMTGNDYHVVADNNPDDGTWSIDSATSPKSMTVIGVQGPNAGKTFPCIYELNTNGNLRICYDLSGAKRPAEFKTAVGTKFYLVTYRHNPE